MTVNHPHLSHHLGPPCVGPSNSPCHPAPEISTLPLVSPYPQGLWEGCGYVAPRFRPWAIRKSGQPSEIPAPMSLTAPIAFCGEGCIGALELLGKLDMVVGNGSPNAAQLSDEGSLAWSPSCAPQQIRPQTTSDVGSKQAPPTQPASLIISSYTQSTHGVYIK